MRSSTEYRDHKIETLRMALQRPMLFGMARCLDGYYSTLLQDLCWIEERESAFDTVCSQLLRGNLRVWGQFHYQHLAIRNFDAEIASTYAQAAWLLGYFTPSQLLSEAQLQALSESVNNQFLSQDRTLTELTTKFGPPTHEVYSSETEVHCYGCSNPSIRWIYFDYSRCYPPTDLVTHDWFDDPRLRDVRRLENNFELLPFGDWCRPSPEAD